MHFRIRLHEINFIVRSVCIVVWSWIYSGMIIEILRQKAFATFEKLIDFIWKSSKTYGTLNKSMNWSNQDRSVKKDDVNKEGTFFRKQKFDCEQDLKLRLLDKYSRRQLEPGIEWKIRMIRQVRIFHSRLQVLLADIFFRFEKKLYAAQALMRIKYWKFRLVL